MPKIGPHCALCLLALLAAAPASAGDRARFVINRGSLSIGDGYFGSGPRERERRAGERSRALRRASFGRESSRFEKSAVVRIAAAFIDDLEVGRIGKLRLKLKIILE